MTSTERSRATSKRGQTSATAAPYKAGGRNVEKEFKGKIIKSLQSGHIRYEDGVQRPRWHTSCSIPE